VCSFLISTGQSERTRSMDALVGIVFQPLLERHSQWTSQN
jgi:hypothetical protein